LKKQMLGGAATGAIAVALVGPSFAADMPVKAPRAQPLAPPALYNWSGFYVGGHVGWGRTKFNGTWFGDSGVTDFSGGHRSGVVGGALLGYNWQFNSFVYGLEADVSFLNWKTNTVGFSGGLAESGDQLSAKLNLLASFRGRWGIAFDRTLLYVTGGLGYAHGKIQGVDGSGPTVLDTNFSKWGGVVGGGVEYAFTNNWIGRVEGLYYFFDESKTLIGSSDSALVQVKDAGIIRAALSYKFGPF
jgi:outer membrane immunogenic protein